MQHDPSRQAQYFAHHRPNPCYCAPFFIIFFTLLPSYSLLSSICFSKGISHSPMGQTQICVAFTTGHLHMIDDVADSHEMHCHEMIAHPAIFAHSHVKRTGLCSTSLLPENHIRLDGVNAICLCYSGLACPEGTWVCFRWHRKDL